MLPAAILIVFCAGGAFRLAAAMRLDTFLAFKQASRDDYYEYARNLRELGVLGILDRPSAFRGIVYPAVLSYLERFHPEGQPLAPVAQAFLGTVTILLTAVLAAQLYGAWGGLLAAALTAFHPVLRSSVPGSRIEILFAFLVLLVALALARWARSPTPRNSVLLGFALSVSILCRSVLFAFPLVLAAAAFRLRVRELRRRSLLLVVAASYAFLFPWVIRNAIQFHGLIPFEDHAATRNLLAGTLGFVENESGPFQDILANEVDPKGVFNSHPIRRMFTLALDRIASSPVSYLVSSLRRLLFLLWLHPWLLLLALVALFKRGVDPAVRAVGLLCVYYFCIHAPMSVEPRYLEPLLPTFAVLAAGAFVQRSEVPVRASPVPIPALILICLIPLYVLSVERLAMEAALTEFPCLLPQGRLSAFHCGEADAAAGRWAEAREKYHKALPLETSPDGEMSLFTAQVRVSEALAELRQVPSTDVVVHETMRSYPEEVLKKALWLQDKGRYEDSLLLFDRLLLTYPRNPSYLSNRGVAGLLTGRVDLARRDLRRSLELLPGNAHASLNYGMLLEGENDRRAALGVYRAALDQARKEALPAPEQPFQYLAMISVRADELGRELQP
ncbi:MAG: glycosyltransferase family 39 protein [Elusimicrobia bacterium]|nr:glycosyltransferase family 39 protein [Elusimicrobiota bacterium]